MTPDQVYICFAKYLKRKSTSMFTVTPIQSGFGFSLKVDFNYPIIAKGTTFMQEVTIITPEIKLDKDGHCTYHGFLLTEENIRNDLINYVIRFALELN